MAVGVKGRINLAGKEGEEFIVHQELSLGATEVDDFRGRGSGGSAGSVRQAPGAGRAQGLLGVLSRLVLMPEGPSVGVGVDGESVVTAAGI